MGPTEDDNPIVRSLLADYPFREAPIRQLHHYLALRDGNRLLAFGPRATGKTAVVGALVSRLPRLFAATINALSHISAKNVYEAVLRQLRRRLVALCEQEEEEEEETANMAEFLDRAKALNITGCTSSPVFLDRLQKLLECFADFVFHLQQVKGEKHLEEFQKKLVLVVDNADAFFQEERWAELVYLLGNIEVLTEKVVPVSVVFISIHSVDWIVRQCDAKWDLLEVVFNSYSIAELNQLLSKRAVPRTVGVNLKYSPEFYASYVNVITRGLNNYTRNLLELQYVCLSNFAHYIAPIEEGDKENNRNGEGDSDDATEGGDCWRITRKDSAKLYLRFQARLQAVIESLNDHKVLRGSNQQSLATSSPSIQLSPSMNYLLVAAYLASYNSAKTDKRYFVRNQGKVSGRRRRRTMLHSKTAENLEAESKAPKPFTFERLFQIYQALLQLNEGSSSSSSNSSSPSSLLISSLVEGQFTELLKQNLVLAIRPTANSSAPISCAGRYQLSDSVTHRQMVTVAEAIGLKLSAFMDNE